MRIVSEAPVRITRATIEAAWRRRSAGARLSTRQGMPWSGSDCEPDLDGLELWVQATGHRSHNRKALAEQDGDSGQPGFPVARGCAD